MHRKSVGITLTRAFACMLVMLAFAPHHHAADEFQTSSQPCSVCISTQQAAAPLAAQSPDLTAPADTGFIAAPTIIMPATVAYHAPLVPRAPPA
jgi:hypothetical protein